MSAPSPSRSRRNRTQRTGELRGLRRAAEACREVYKDRAADVALECEERIRRLMLPEKKP